LTINAVSRDDVLITKETQMKKLVLVALAASALATTAAAPAMAAPWQSINQRQAQLDHRIDVGVRNGSLTRNEAYRLRTEFRQIARLESRYRSSHGLQAWERRDLDRRFDILSAKIRYERRDNDHRGYGHRR
jgi:opacity protein-like surface antigen